MAQQTKKIELRGPKLFKWQQDVMYSIFNNWKGTIHTIKSKRQVGKSVMLEYILIKTAIERTGSDSFVVSPTSAQSAKIFGELVKAVRNTPVFKQQNGSSLTITFSNGSRILFKSAEQRDNLRGYTVTGVLCIDEAAYISDDVISDILPWVDANQAPVILTSTPIGRQGLFYEFFIKGEDESNIKCFSYDWAKYDTSELLSDERKQFYKSTLPKQKYITDILGEFLEGDSTVFGEYEAIMTDDIDLTDKKTYFGIDWGTGQGGDDTVISIFNSKRQMVDIVRFNDKDETQTINTIINLAKRYNPIKITVELNSIGRVFFGLLDKSLKINRIKTVLRGFQTTNESKDDIISALQVAIQNKDITLLDNNDLRTQLSMYEMKMSNTGKRIYNAKNGYHDDMIMATAICLDSIKSAQYCLS